MRLPRRFRTLFIPTIIVLITGLLILHAFQINIQNQQNTGNQAQITTLQIMVGISQVLIGVTTAIISLIGAYDFLAAERNYIMNNWINISSLH